MWLMVFFQSDLGDDVYITPTRAFHISRLGGCHLGTPLNPLKNPLSTTVTLYIAHVNSGSLRFCTLSPPPLPRLSSTLFERSSSPTTQYVATTSSPQQIARQDRYESRILHCTCQDVRYTVLCCMYLGKTSRHDRRCTCESLNASEPRAWCYRRFSDL